MGHALDLYDAGFRRLVPVIPPSGEISATSRIQAAQRGKVPGRKNAAGKWTGFPKWQLELPTREQIAKYEAGGANIGLIAQGFPALDIDSLDVEVANAVEGLACMTLGPAPVRYGLFPKRLLVYRCEEDFKEMRIKILKNGKWHLIEMLSGPKRQYLVQGQHPSGTAYRWEGVPLWGWTAEGLTPITRDEVMVFFAAVEKYFEAEGCEVKRLGGLGGDTPPPPQTDLYAPSFEDLVHVVESIPNDEEHSPDREHYLNMAYAIKAASGESEHEGRALFYGWAGKRTPDDRVAGNAETWEADWNRCHPPYRLGWAWLLQQSPSSASMEFEADPNAVTPHSIDAIDPNVDEKDMLALVADVLRPAMCYATSGFWYRWTGERWEGCDNALSYVMDACGVVAARLKAQIEVAPTKTEAAPLMRLAKTLCSIRFMESAERVLRRRLRVDVNTFDADPWLLNTPAGIVDLRLGVAREATQSDMCAKSTSVAPEQGAHPVWSRFLDETTGGDKDLERYLQKYVGYCATGHTYEQTLLFVWGPGGNGKSVFVNAVMHALGDYSETAPMDTFASSKDKHPTDIAGLAGARLVSAQETNIGRKWDEARIKALTSGEPMRVRFMKKDFFTMTPMFGLMLVGNHPPEIRALDDAMRRRLRIVPFVRKPVTVDMFLSDKLRGEAPQILQWIVDGCLLWQREGLGTVAAVEAQTETYFAEEDPIQQWLDDKCSLSNGVDQYGVMPLRCASITLYRSWCQWCNAAGEEHGSQKQFIRRLGAKLGRKSTAFRDSENVLHRGFYGIDIQPLNMETLI